MFIPSNERGSGVCPPSTRPYLESNECHTYSMTPVAPMYTGGAAEPVAAKLDRGAFLAPHGLTHENRHDPPPPSRSYTQEVQLNLWQRMLAEVPSLPLMTCPIRTVTFNP